MNAPDPDGLVINGEPVADAILELRVCRLETEPDVDGGDEEVPLAMVEITLALPLGDPRLRAIPGGAILCTAEAPAPPLSLVWRRGFEEVDAAPATEDRP